MSNLLPTNDAQTCAGAPTDAPVLESIAGRPSNLGGLPIRRLLPRRARRMVGAWCFFDAFGPLSFSTGKPMDVAPHPHIGLQTVSWLQEGEVLHHDSLGLSGLATPGVLNLMTAGRGIAHAEETPPANAHRLRGVQLWVALPAAHRDTEPAFAQHTALPRLTLEHGYATLILGDLAGLRSPARVFSPLVAAEIAARAPGPLTVPLQPSFEHAVVLLAGACTIQGRALEVDALTYLGCGRRELTLLAQNEQTRVLVLGGEPFGESILMWWNFVARTNDEIVAAREDWEAGRRFGEVEAYDGARLKAPPFVARPMRG